MKKITDKERKKNMSAANALAKARRILAAKCRFRAAVRLAYENRNWLEDTEGEQLGMNVAKNIKILTRKKPKGQFTLIEKAMMKVPQEKRTDAEKHYLYRVLGGIKCFRKYPPEVKKELAAITYYAEICPDRKVVRQGDEAVALYFIISGTSRVVAKKIDELTGQPVDYVLRTKEPGDIFGELALLLGTQRTATIITNENSEFIYVLRNDFDRVLRDTVLREWNEIKKSMSLFEYFKFWDDRFIQQSCMISKMRYYEEKALILSEDYGDQRYVYFLIDGIVDLIECVDMEVITFENKKTYYLHNPWEEDEIKKACHAKSLVIDLGKYLKDKIDADEKGASSELKLKTASTRFSKPSIYKMSTYTKLVAGVSSSTFDVRVTRKKFRRNTLNVPNKNLPYEQELKGMDPAYRIRFVKKQESLISRVICPKEIPIKSLEPHFIKVASMNRLATFNIGEHLNHRFYVSRTKVKLLAVPHYWLVSRDKPTWNNIKIFLRTRLPTRHQLFEEFTKKQKWQEYRKECYCDIANKLKKPNFNSINNVPYGTRLRSDLSFFVFSKVLENSRNNLL